MIDYSELFKASCELTDTAFLLLYRVSLDYSLCVEKNRQCRLSYNDIRDMVNKTNFTSKTQFFGALDELVEKGYIETERKKGCKPKITSCKLYKPVSNKYRLDNKPVQLPVSNEYRLDNKPVSNEYNHSKETIVENKKETFNQSGEACLPPEA